MPRREGRTLRTKQQRKNYIGSVVERELVQADGSDSDELQANRKQALDYYNAVPRGDEIANRSQVVSTDVSDMCNATLAMLVPMLTTDALVAFKANGTADVPQAKSESDIVNSIVLDENNGFIEVQEAVKDAFLMKNGCMKVRVDESVDTIRYDISNADKEQRAHLMLSAAPNEQREIDGDELVVTTTTRTFDTSAVPIENISYQSGYCGPLQQIRFFAERIEYTRSELIELGYSRAVVDRLNAYSEADTSTQRARDVSSKSRRDAETRDQDIIDCHEAYLLIDMDGDGISERYKCLVANRKVCLDYEPTDILPYALGTPFINPHRITGESLFDHLKATQDSKTAFLRQWHDNVTAINNGKVAYDPARVAEDDVLKPIAGGGIRARNPRDSVVPIPIPDVSSGILQALTYEDQRRSERGGASLDMLTADAQLVGETAHGIERQYASREALASMMAANIALTMIRDLYLITHEFIRRHAVEPFEVEVHGEWVQVDARRWPLRKRLNVLPGMSPGQRGHLQNVLAQHMQLQITAMQSGMNGVLADAETLYRTNQAWLRLAGVDNPERLAIDPRSPAAQQAAKQNAEAQQAAAAKQDALIQAQLQIQSAQLAENARQHDGDLAHKYYDTDTDAAVAEAKIAGQGVITLEQERIRASATYNSGPGGDAPRASGDRAGAKGGSQ